MALCDEDGTPVFEAEDVKAQHNALYQHLIKSALAAIGYGREEKTDEEEDKEAGK